MERGCCAHARIRGALVLLLMLARAAFVIDPPFLFPFPLVEFGGLVFLLSAETAYQAGRTGIYSSKPRAVSTMTLSYLMAV